MNAILCTHTQEKDFKMVTKYGDNYKISANLINVKDPYMASVKIDFNEKIPNNKLPDIEVSFSTESAGFVRNKFAFRIYRSWHVE